MSNIEYGKSIAIFKNVDETILKLNPFLKDKKYKFQAVTILELKNEYLELFLPRGNSDIDDKTFQEIYRNHLFGLEFPFSTGIMYMLVNEEPIKYEFIDKHYPANETWKLRGATQKFKNELIRKLRFFKKGDINSPAQFTILDKSRKLMGAGYNAFQKVTSHVKYEIHDDELTSLEEHLYKEFKSSDLTNIAETYFHNSYEVNDYNIKFINLITALESLFNSSNNQISQVLSRHLAILISENKDEFQNNYARIKKLYGIRSKLIHGQTLSIKENIEELVDEVYTLARIALIRCMELELNKSELFKELNSRGF